jgi:hypothetical protein
MKTNLEKMNFGVFLNDVANTQIFSVKTETRPFLFCTPCTLHNWHFSLDFLFSFLSKNSTLLHFLIQHFSLVFSFVLLKNSSNNQQRDQRRSDRVRKTFRRLKSKDRV